VGFVVVDEELCPSLGRKGLEREVVADDLVDLAVGPVPHHIELASAVARASLRSAIVQADNAALVNSFRMTWFWLSAHCTQ
jgi:hypothetical protein